MMYMVLHDICLNCGHKRNDHDNDSRCQNDMCPCLGFKSTTLTEKIWGKWTAKKCGKELDSFWRNTTM